ncbi:hypothetical protein TWF694_010542 [Orbilia ellipsospora]|uniref:Serine protease n=1 Tax=Orbilia ellipsospora TaxID=2528407 RepID=A0AAV9XCX3_9PEZI
MAQDEIYSLSSIMSALKANRIASNGLQQNDPKPRREDNRIDGLDQQRYNEWVQKLAFTIPGSSPGEIGLPGTGTGFYVNIPHCEYDVIFTAAHNLVDRGTGELFQDIRIVTVHPHDDIPVDTENIKYCTKYLGDHDDLDKEISDYGVILFKREPRQSRKGGFGFNLYASNSALEEISPNSITVHITSFPLNTPAGRPLLSSGELVSCKEGQLHHTGSASEGSSGGPIWMGHEGTPIVVGIHNYGSATEATKENPNRATLLNFSVFSQIFEWCGVSFRDRAIRTTTGDHYFHFKMYDRQLTPSITYNPSPAPNFFSLFPSSSPGFNQPTIQSEYAGRSPDDEQAFGNNGHMSTSGSDKPEYYFLDFCDDKSKRWPLMATKQFYRTCNLTLGSKELNGNNNFDPKNASKSFYIRSVDGKSRLKFNGSGIDAEEFTKHEVLGASSVQLCSIRKFKEDVSSPFH